MISKRSKKQKAAEIPVIKQELSIQDDPYWKLSSIHMDPHRVGRFISKFERFEYLHPEWAAGLMDGLPTFYCILGVERGAPKEQIEQAYERKSRFSSYPLKVIAEAFDVLRNPRLQKEYDDLLITFEQVTKCMPSHEKHELAQKHSAYISVEKEYTRMNQLLGRYKDYDLLYLFGMPDLYEIAGLAQDCTTEEISRTCGSDSELSVKISTVLKEPASREEYDFMLDFIARRANKEHLEERERNRKKWASLDRHIFEKIVLMALTEPGTLSTSLRRRGEILTNNQDWQQYLPPYQETFLSLLGLDTASLSTEKKEVESALRERYRPLEKTPLVNLAYSVLKNKSQREDYLWLLENYELLETLASLLTVENVPGATGKEGVELPSMREAMDALARLFAEWERGHRKGRDTHLSTEEIMAILSSHLRDETIKEESRRRH